MDFWSLSQCDFLVNLLIIPTTLTWRNYPCLVFLEWRYVIPTEAVEDIGSVTNVQTMLILLKMCYLGLKASKPRVAEASMSILKWVLRYGLLFHSIVFDRSIFCSPCYTPVALGWGCGAWDENCFIGFQK